MREKNIWKKEVEIELIEMEIEKEEREERMFLLNDWIEFQLKEGAYEADIVGEADIRDRAEMEKMMEEEI